MGLVNVSDELSILLLVGMIALVVLVIAGLLRDRGGRPSSDALSDGMVMLIDRGRILRASPGAEERFGPCGTTAAAAIEPVFGRQSSALTGALDELEQTGRPFHLMLRDANERLHEAIGRSQGALTRLTFREAQHMDGELRELRRRLGQIENDHDILVHQLAALRHLMSEGMMVVWTRSGDGLVNWSEGSIRTAGGTIAAHDVALMVSSQSGRGTFRTGETSAPVRALVQMARPGGADTIPLNSVELAAGAGQIIGFAVDGSRAADAERSLARFVKTMTETFAHLKAGLAIFDRSGELFLFNPALAAIWRADPAWLATRPTLREVLDDLRIKRRLPEDADIHHWRDRLLGLIGNADAPESEHVWHLGDGSIIRVMVRPHPDGALALMFDNVTDRVRLEQSYRNSIDLRHAILDRLDEGIAVFGPDGQTQFANQAFQRIWNFSAASVTRDSHAREVVPLCAAATREAGVWRRLEGFITGEESRGSWGARLTMTDGRALSARFAPLPDGSTMTVFTDVTDSERIAQALRERNEALEAAESMRTELLDEISYRLRTPLNSVAGFSELLLDARTGTLNDLQRDYAENILQAAQALNEAVSGVSDMVEMPDQVVETGDGHLFVEDVIEHTRRLLERRAGERDIRLRVGLEAPIGDFPLDPVRMGQIAFNLAHDAINRCASGGAVVLGASRAAGGALQIWTSETAAEPPASDTATLPGLELLRRQVALENGFVEIDPRPDDSVLRVTCRFFPRSTRTIAAEAAPDGIDDDTHTRWDPNSMTGE